VPLSKPSLKNTPAATDEFPADEEDLELELAGTDELEATDELATEDFIELEDSELDTEERMELEATELDTEERIELEATELETTEEERTELADELTEEVAEPQTAPVTCGTSAVAPVLLPWNPISTVWLGAMVPFQLRFVAEYGLVPLYVAFHPLVMRLSPLYCQATVQPLTVLVPELVIFIAALKPSPHWLVTTY